MQAASWYSGRYNSYNIKKEFTFSFGKRHASTIELKYIKHSWRFTLLHYRRVS